MHSIILNTVWIVFLLYCKVIQALKCHEEMTGNNDMLIDLTNLGETDIICNADGVNDLVQLSWNFQIPDGEIRYYQIEYQCYDGNTYNKSENIVVKDFYNELSSPQVSTITNVTGTRCIIAVCVKINWRRDSVMRWLDENFSACMLNAAIPVSSSIISFPSILSSQFITTTTLATLHSYQTASTITTATTATSATAYLSTITPLISSSWLEISPTNHVETSSMPLSETFKNNLVLTAVFTIGSVLSVLIIGLSVAIFIRHYLEKKRNKETFDAAVLRGIEIVRTDSSTSLKTVICIPVTTTESSNNNNSNENLSDKSSIDTVSIKAPPMTAWSLQQKLEFTDETGYVTAPAVVSPYITYDESPNNTLPVVISSSSGDSSGYVEEESLSDLSEYDIIDFENESN